MAMPLTQDPANALAMATRICQRFEGCVLTAYHGAADRPGLYSIGYGTTSIDGAPVQPGSTITQEQADQYLADELTRVQNAVEGMLTTQVQDYQEAALISFGYNLGTSALHGSTLLKFVNAGDFDAAAGQFGLWVHANGQVVNGLVARRAYEAQVFQNEVQP
jgi:GH24 family phage-related lysozyme (muramidase)